ncbi:MAG: hypothetical protein KBG20_01155 [Caldilineaceae bacterium]|nr:hypothetical protein [Caldilineaceae bacterium]MBP8106594.1 hypothetical protein [Caldilineaceae bacterium]MBP8121301.1 hypothetical protein [Caldilineaceae bacterium]MBP9070867.1 hypothetical protein [Caldilineaceae bacterium]
MGYLVAARDVTDLGQETRAGLTYTRYAFRIDGPTFALSVRAQLDEAMRQKGDVPPGVTFEAPAYYRDMTGSGELWVGEDGLPIRQILSLHFPEQNSELVSAHIAVNFSQFGQGDGASTTRPGGPGGVGTRLPSALGTFELTPGKIASSLLTAFLLGLLALFILFRRTRRLQQILSVTLVITLLGGPILGNLRMTRFLGGQTVRAAELDQQQVEANSQRALMAQSAVNAFDPHQDQRTTVRLA